MGSLERKLKRRQERRAFDQFTEEFRLAKRNGQKRPDGKELGRKPGYGEFRRRLKMLAAINETKRKTDELAKQEAEKKIDTEWKEE